MQLVCPNAYNYSWRNNLLHNKKKDWCIATLCKFPITGITKIHKLIHALKSCLGHKKKSCFVPQKERSPTVIKYRFSFSKNPHKRTTEKFKYWRERSLAYRVLEMGRFATWLWRFRYLSTSCTSTCLGSQDCLHSPEPLCCSPPLNLTSH